MSSKRRYIKDGIKSIINIKLKRKNHPYIWYELATRHDIPLCNGFGVGYFEVGNPKYSLYGRSSVSYIYHNDIDSDISRSDTGYKQSFSQRNRQDKRNWLGELLFKGNPSQKDYLPANPSYRPVTPRTGNMARGRLKLRCHTTICSMVAISTKA